MRTASDYRRRWQFNDAGASRDESNNAVRIWSLRETTKSKCLTGSALVTTENSDCSRRSMLGLTTGAAISAAMPSTSRAAAGVRSDIVLLDAVALSSAIHSRQFSCVEVMTAYLDHIDKLNPKVNAIVALQDRGGLLAQSRERDAQLARGELMGPLHGLPLAVKDLAPVKGIRMTMGSPILKDFVPTADGIMVERLRTAGAIFIGKTNTPEFGLGSHTYNT